MNAPPLPIVATLLALLVSAGWSAFGPGSGLGLGPEAAAAKQRCQGAKRPPHRIKVRRADRLVVCLANRRRKAHGLGKLKRKRSIERAAVRHTRQMQRRECFAHRCPGEPALVGRLTRTSYLPCNCRWGVRENLAWGRGSRASPAAIMRAWMSSSKHRTALLDPALEHIGVGFRRGGPFSGRRRLGTYTLDLGYKD